MKKFSVIICSLVCAMFILSTTVLAGSHYGSYDMTGGIFYKQHFNSGTSLTVSVDPVIGSPDCKMGIYTARKSFFGYSGASFIANVSSVYRSITHYTPSKNIDGIYFRNWAGKRWIGNFTVSW